jgi:hypothetical protein
VAFDELMRLTNRLLAYALALAAIAARLRLDELGESGDPALREQLDRAVDELGLREQLGGLDAGERAVLLAFAGSYPITRSITSRRPSSATPSPRF